MNLKLIAAQSIRRLYVGCVRLQKLDRKRIAFFVTMAASASFSLLLFQNFTPTSPPPPAPPADYVLRPNYKFLPYDGYLIPYVPRGNPRPMSPAVALQKYLMAKAAHTVSMQQLTRDTSCKTIAITYKGKDPKTNLAVRTFTFACGNLVVTRNDVFDRGPHGSPNPVGQFIIKTPVKIANVAAAKRN
jgi:hypothetical protein